MPRAWIGPDGRITEVSHYQDHFDVTIAPGADVFTEGWVRASSNPQYLFLEGTADAIESLKTDILRWAGKPTPRSVVLDVRDDRDSEIEHGEMVSAEITMSEFMDSTVREIADRHRTEHAVFADLVSRRRPVRVRRHRRRA
jgi:hypothetical protein